ncbi:MAG: glycosyl hydrolase family 18 protein [Halococcoides sp.]
MTALIVVGLVLASGPAPGLSAATTSPGPPPIGDAAPTDLDGDGRYEDINGNGHWGFPDVNLLFRHSDRAIVRDNAAAYDFTGDGSISLQDVMALFRHDDWPTGRIDVRPGAPVQPDTTVTLDGSNSTAPDGIAAYRWTVDNRSIGTGPTVEVTFGETGPHRVSLTLRDGDGSTAVATRTIRVQSSDRETTDRRTIGYYRSWSRYQRNYMPADVPLGDLSHMNYAFLDVKPNGTVVLGDSWGDRQNLQAFEQRSRAHPNTTMMLSIGGWSYSDDFSDAAMTAERRERFADSAVRLMRRYNFDGIDVDWEYPGGGGAAGNTVRPDDAHNFTLLMQALDRRLERAEQTDNREYTTSIAVSADPTKFERLEWNHLENHVDLVNLMTYDYSGSWSDRTGHNAPLRRPHTAAVDSVREATRAFEATGFPMDRVQVGVPFYGRGFAGVEGPPVMNQSFTDTPSGTYGSSGVYTAAHVERLNNSSAVYQFHDEAAVPTLYLPERGVVISYPNERSVRAKAAFARRSSAGGTMIWALGQDPEGRLLAALRAELSS